jgi:aspartokinase
MREVADLILSFPDETPVVVLSAMGKTTNNLLLVLPISSSPPRWPAVGLLFGF